jgi:protein-tyrosine phosphatase
MIDATRLASKLYIGSKPPLGTAVADNGFDVLVLCAREYQPRLHNFPGLSAVIHAPLDDDKLTTKEIDIAYMTAMEVHDHVLEEDRVLVTCMAGRNRSGLICTMALHLLTCCEPRQCIMHVKKNRVGIDGGEALSNPNFVNFLKNIQVAC